VDEINRFYRVYHSMQYIPDRLMLRLRRPPDTRQLADINREFADILTQGEFTIQDAPLGEIADAELASLTRLVFPFNRRNHGRLRMLIDWINAQIA
jgi:hypothetical protein